MKILKKIVKKQWADDEGVGLNLPLKVVLKLIAAVFVVIFIGGVISGIMSGDGDDPSGSSGELQSFTLGDEASTEKPKKRKPTVEDELNMVFADLAKANQTEDIDLFMSRYAKSFPDRDQKKSNTLERWKSYDFLSLDFFIFDSKVEGDTAKVSVGWEMAFREGSQAEPKVLETTNEVTLEKGRKGWMIVAFE